MKYLLALITLLGALAAQDWRALAIAQIDATMDLYQKRLVCLKEHEAAYCIERFPQDPRSDALAKTFAMSFPAAFYAAKIQRDIKILERQKLCIGRAATQEAAKECPKDFR